MPGAHQGAGGHVTDPRGLYDEHARATVCEPAIPIEDLRRHEAILCAAPGHHRWHPSAGARMNLTQSSGGEDSALAGLLFGGPAGLGDAVLGCAQGL